MATNRNILISKNPEIQSLLKDIYAETDWLLKEYQNVKFSQRVYHYVFPTVDIKCPSDNNKIFIGFEKGYKPRCNEYSCKPCFSYLSKIRSDNMKDGGAYRALMGYKTKTGKNTPFHDSIIQKKIRANGSIFGRMYYSLDTLNILNSEAYWNSLEKNKSIFELCDELPDEINYSTISWYAKKYNYTIRKTSCSKVQNKLKSFIDQLNINFIENDRKIIRPLELDFVFPDHKLAIEVNGLWTHSEINGNKDKFYHINKTNLANEMGYQLIHFFDCDINNKFDIVSSMLKSKLNLNDKIWARKCNVIEISNNTAKHFHEMNHISGGSVNCSYNYALKYKNDIVSVMSLSKPRYSRKADLELIRFSTLLNYNVVGGFSKLLSKIKGESIISYANIMYSNGNVYRKNNFKMINITKPNYFYILDQYNRLYSRIKFQKHKLPNLLEFFDPNLTEWENMKNNGYDRIWDCGNYVFLKEI